MNEKDFRCLLEPWLGLMEVWSNDRSTTIPSLLLGKEVKKAIMSLKRW